MFYPIMVDFFSCPNHRKLLLINQTRIQNKLSACLSLYLGKFSLLDSVLISLIFLGIAFRLIYPFYNNPMSHLITDPGRHYDNALGTSDRAYRYLDPLGYQCWLGTCFKLFGHSAKSVAVYTGLLSASTPLLWYLWLCQSLTTKRLALVGLAILTFLPSWLGIYAYFMTETLVLPLLGLALWLTWRSAKQPCWHNILLCALAWAFATATKLNVAPEAIISLAWLFWQLKRNRGKVYSVSALAVIWATIAAAYLVGVVDTYQGLGTTWLFPQRMAAATQLYHQSGARGFSIYLKSKTFGTYKAGEFESPAACTKSLLEPFGNWTSGRSGVYSVIIDCTQPPRIFFPGLPMSLSNRLHFIKENILNFFFNRSWPDCDQNDFVQLSQERLIWIWPLITLLIVSLAWEYRTWNILITLCLGTALITCLQQQSLMEGRYRKPWEGVAIAAILSLLEPRKSKMTFGDATSTDN